MEIKMKKLLKQIEQFLCGWLGHLWDDGKCADCGFEFPDDSDK